jgi:hypothetical protein
MPAETVGGLWITSYEFTRSFGVEPASASGKAIIGSGGGSAGLDVGEYRVYSFGGIAFYGLVSQVIGTQERITGLEYDFQLVDNRVRLPGKIFFGQFNMPEAADATSYRALVRPPVGEFASGGSAGGDGMDFSEVAAAPGASSAGSLDPATDVRGRVFRHIVPSQHAVQVSSYTDSAVSAADILRVAFRTALGNFGFALDLHPDCDLPIYEIDANSGMTLAALVSEVCGKLGLEVTLDGSRTLRFERRGEGTLVIPAGAHLRRDGLSMSSDATKVCVMGDRTLVQVNNIPLEADWKRPWEAFLSEPAWLDEVNRVFGPFAEDSSGRAENAAMSREVTLRQYIVTADLDATWIDRGRWGKVSRMNMPVWSYLNSILFRSYRIGTDKFLYGLPMVGLELHDGLLCSVELAGEDEDAEIGYSQSPVQFYPEASAFVIARGQPLDLLAAADRESVVRNRVKDMRTQWGEVADFTLDPLNHSIRFASPVFLDGDPAENKSILLFPNKGEGGHDDVSAELGEGSEYFRVVVPNPDYEIQPAELKVSLCFRLGLWQSFHGSGQRFTLHSAPALALHLLDGATGISHSLLDGFSGDLPVPTPPGAGLAEITYEDGENTQAKADAQAAGLTSRSATDRSGEYVRHGVAGTAVNGVIDRVSIRVTREEGIVETVEFSKPRSADRFIPSRDFARRARTEELFDGQTELRREARMLRTLSRLDRQPVNDPVRSSSHAVLTDVMRRPVGGEVSSVKTFADPLAQWPARGEGVTGWRAGDLCWLDEKGVPSRKGKAFGGVVVSTPPVSPEGEAGEQVKWLTLATDGTVPVAVEPGIEGGCGLFASPGDWKASYKGSKTIGVLAHGESVPRVADVGNEHKSVMALVRLGAAGREGRTWEVTMGPGSRLFVGSGHVFYVEIEGGANVDRLPSEAPQARFIRGIVPTLEGTKLDASERPHFDASEHTDGTVWLICRSSLCSSDLPDDEPERVMLTEKDAKPDIMRGEVAIEIASFDLEEIEGTTGQSLKDLVYGLDSDWEQPYLCENDTDSDNDGSGVEQSDESDPPYSDPTPSDDTDDPPVKPAGCKIRVTVQWMNAPTCFGSTQAFDGTGWPCTPGPGYFEIAVTFNRVDPFDKICPGYAFGVKMPGSSTPEYVWINQWGRTLRFAWDFMPACLNPTIEWRVRGFGPLLGPNNEVIPSCCGFLFKGSGRISPQPMPPVCGCDCYESSAGDLDGDGIPNAADSDLDGDGWNNVVDGDVDGDGLLDDVDPDIDGDGIANAEDPTPEGL